MQLFVVSLGFSNFYVWNEIVNHFLEFWKTEEIAK